MTRNLRLILLTALLVVGITPGTTGAQTAASTASITIGTTEPLTNLDPADSGDFFNWALLTHLYIGLTRQRPGTLEFDLALATTHTASDDARTHTFTIRPDATFNNGEPITAATFARAINRVIRLNGRGASVVTPYVSGVRVDRSGALVLSLTEPRSLDFVRGLVALPPYFPANPDTFPDDSLSRLPDITISNGPYRVDKSDAGRLTLTADAAWKGEPPKTTGIILRSYELPADLRVAIRAGEIDLAWRVVTPEDSQVAAGPESGKFQITSAPALQAFYLLIAPTQPPLNDPIVRRGMLYLLDRDRAARFALNGTGAPLYTLLPPQITGATDSAARYPAFDLDKGLAVLAEGGYSNFKRIDSDLQISRLLYGDFYATAADALITTLVRQEAFRIGRSDLEPKTFREQIERGTFRLNIIGWTPVVPHPDAYLRPLLAGEISAATYSNPAIAAALDEAAITRDPAQVRVLYTRVQALAAQDMFAVPLWQMNQLALVADSLDPASVLIEPNYVLHFERLARR